MPWSDCKERRIRRKLRLTRFAIVYPPRFASTIGIAQFHSDTPMTSLR